MPCRNCIVRFFYACVTNMHAFKKCNIYNKSMNGWMDGCTEGTD